MFRSIAPALALLTAVSSAAAQGQPSPTPPVTSSAAAAGSSLAAPQDALVTPFQGDDIQANTVTTGAQNDTSLAVNPLDELNWVGVSNDYQSGNVKTGWFTTLDGGETWTSGLFPIDEGWSYSGAPAVTFDSQGQAHAICMMYEGPGNIDRVSHFLSIDGGLTWEASTVVGEMNGYDKPQIEANLATGIHPDELLVAWSHFGAALGVDNIVVSASEDSGATWSPPQVINDTSQVGIGADVAWGPHGEAYVLWADRGVFDVMFDRSFDGGQTWGPDIKVADYTHVPDILPGSSFRVFDIFALYADQTTGPFAGRVYAAYHTWADGILINRSDVLVAASGDMGATWTPGVKVSSDGGQNDQLFPGLVVDRQGSVNVCYYDQRKDPADDLLWTWMSRSFDGGHTWKDVQISDVGWNDDSTEFFGSFIGDYIDNEAASTGTLHPFWCDGRSGSQDVYTDKVNPQLFTSAQSLSAATGGAVNFDFGLGPNLGGHGYILVASGSGTSPGITLFGGVHAPLNPDFWTDISIAFANTALFPGSFGVLTLSGTGKAVMNTLGPFPAAFAGTNLDFSVVSINAGVATHATPPTRVALLP